MSRDRFIKTGATDLTPTVTNNVLWSFVLGEQLEFPVQLGFVIGYSWANALNFEATVVEGDNLGDGSVPTGVAVNAKTHKVIVEKLRAPTQWVASLVPYVFGDTVYFTHPADGAGIYRFTDNESLLKTGDGTSYLDPAADTSWEKVTGNEVYLRFPGIPDVGEATPVVLSGITTTGVGAEWAVKPTPTANVYGFFELRVTENMNGSGFPRTWKPLRGLVELLYSPTLAG